MTILFVTRSFWDEPHRGRHHFASVLKNSHRVIWINRQTRLLENKFNRKGISLTADYLSILNTSRSFLPVRLDLFLNWNIRFHYSQVMKILIKYNITPDLVWIYDYKALPLAKHFVHKGVRTIYFCNDYFGEDVYKYYESELAQSVDHVFCTSPRLQDRFIGLNRNTHFLPHGVWLPQSKTVYKKKDAPETAGYIGTLRNAVDISFLRQIIEHTSLKLILAGPIIECSRIKRDEFESLMVNKKVTYLGNLSRLDAESALDLIDIGLLPYISDIALQHGFAIKYFEYLAAGKPVVATPYFDWPEPYNQFVNVYDGKSNINEFLHSVYAKWNSDYFSSATKLASRSSWEQRIHEIGQITGVNL